MNRQEHLNRWCVGLAILWLAGSVNAAPIVVGCIGDYGSDYISTRQVARLVKSWQPHFILTVGDNNYPRGEAHTLDRNVGQFYHEFIEPYQGRYGTGSPSNRFFPCLGNHDWLTANARPYLDYFTLPGNERYYTFTGGAAQFFCVDSDKREPNGATPDSVQGQWLRESLEQSSAVWRVVYFHHAALSSGYYHGTHTGECAHMSWPFHEWGADVVLTGHDHIYERIHTNGIVYIVNGLGGDSRDKLLRRPIPGSVMRFSSDFGALRLDVAENYLFLRFFTWRGTQIDSLRLVPRKREPKAETNMAPEKSTRAATNPE